MAIYRKGKATLDDKGVIRGEGTKWKSKLSLIRSGATVIFATNPVKFAVISEVIDDVTIQAVGMGKDTVSTMSDYVILIHDSLTVDGLAQDVAETLRYYQGKENQFAHFIEVVQTLDPDKLKELIAQITEQNDKFQENFGEVKRLAIEVQQNTDKVEQHVSDMQGLKSEVTNLRNQTEGFAHSAQESVTLAQGEVTKAAGHAQDALRDAGVARAEAVKAKSEADRAETILTNGNEQFNQVVQSSKAEITQQTETSKQEIAGSAQAEVDRAKEQADRAKAEADRAEDMAHQFDVAGLMRADKNLSDLVDKAQARKNLGVDNIRHDELETKMLSKSGVFWFSLRNAEGRPWGVWDSGKGQWVALGIEQGGTGAVNVLQARENLKIDRFKQDLNMTRIKSADDKTELRIGQDDWYVYRDSNDSEKGYVALGIQGGGTGGRSADEARENLEVDRLVQQDGATLIGNPTGHRLVVKDNGEWGAVDASGAWDELALTKGGTGANSAAGARKNLEVDRLVQSGTSTSLGKAGGNRLAVNDGGEWGALDGSNNWIALAIGKGGTGAKDAAGARNNLEALYFKRTALGASDNLNNISGFDKVGIYYNAANANATTANNYPVQFAGVLVVLSARGNGVEQTMQYYYPYIQPEMYYVRYYNKQGSAWSWSKWERYESADYLRGDAGLTTTGVLGPANANDLRKNCFFAGAGSDSQNYKLPYSPGIAMRRVNTTTQLQIDGGNGTIWTRASVDGGAWTEWKAAAMLQSSPTFTGGSISVDGNGKTARMGSGSSDIYVANLKSNKYLQLKDDGSLQYDSKHIMHHNLNYTAGIYDVTLKTFRITANGNNLHLKATTNTNPQVFLAGFNSGDTRLYWMGCGTNDNAVTLRSDIGGNQIKLLSDGAINLETAAGAKNIYAYADNFIVRKGSRAFSYNNRGTSSQDGQIYLWGASGRPDVIEFGFSSGYGFYIQRNTDNSRLLQVNGKVQCTSLVQGSDRDLKEDIETIQNATESLRKMNGYTYTLKSDGMPYAGVIAQEVMEALPEAISGGVNYVDLPGPTANGEPLQGEERYLGVDYSAVTGLLVQVCRESDDRITKLEAEVAELKELVSQLLNK